MPPTTKEVLAVKNKFVREAGRFHQNSIMIRALTTEFGQINDPLLR